MKIHTLAIQIIAAAPENVYTALTTPHTFPTHFNGYGPIPGISHEVLPDGISRYQVGLARRMYGDDGSMYSEKVTELEYPNLFAYESTGVFGKSVSWMANHGRSVWNFLPHHHHTLVEWHYVCTLTSPLFYPLASLLIKFCMKKAMQACLKNYKTSLEKKVAATA